MKAKKYLILSLVLLASLISACSGNLATINLLVNNSIAQKNSQVAEYNVENIPLLGDLANRNSEISGLAWYKDYLILLPQYPNFARNGSFLYAIAKKDIREFLDNTDIKALEPIKIPIDLKSLAKDIDGYEGFEAIAFSDNNIYLNIEANTKNGMRSYLLAGTIAEDLSGIILNTNKLTEIVPPVNLRNQSDEAILIVDNKIISIFEANGKDVNSKPEAHEFATDLEILQTTEFPRVEYRITDSTQIDENNRFWVINYFYPGDTDLYSDNEPIAAQFGQGASHSKNEQVERLLELEYKDGQIILSGSSPIQLELMADVARNWEGIVRLDDKGFLLATDKYPETILGFVAIK